MSKYSIVILLLIFLLGFTAGCRPQEGNSSGAGSTVTKQTGTSEPAPDQADVPPSAAPQDPLTDYSHDPLPAEMPEDFNICFEFGKSSVDTYKGKITKDLVMDGNAEAELAPAVSSRLKAEWYQKLLNYKIYSIEREMTSKQLSTDGTFIAMTPCTQYAVTFTADGKQYRVEGDATAYEYVQQSDEAARFTAFCDEMIDSVTATECYASLPDARGAYC